MNGWILVYLIVMAINFGCSLERLVMRKEKYVEAGWFVVISGNALTLGLLYMGGVFE